MKIAAKLALIAMIAAAGCHRGDQEFLVTVKLQTDQDLELSSIPVSANGVQLGSTGKNGELRLKVKGTVGDTLKLHLKLPEDLSVAKEPAYTFALTPNGAPQPIEANIEVKSVKVQYGLVVQARPKCARVPVRFQNEDIGVTDEDGFLSVSVRAQGGSTAHVEADDPARPECHLACDLELKPGPSFINCDFATAPKVQPVQRAAVNPTPVVDQHEKVAETSHAATPVATVGTPPQTSSPPVKGARPVTVVCEPAGLSITLDGEVVVPACTGNDQVQVKPGIHKFGLKSPPGGQPCPPYNLKPQKIADRGEVAPVMLKTDCKDCLTSAKDKAAAGQDVGQEGIACLQAVKADDPSYQAVQILLAFAFEKQHDYGNAEKVLREVIASPQGRYDPEAYERLGKLALAKKAYLDASDYADKAWQYRMKFRGDAVHRNVLMVNALTIKASALEKQFYDKGDVGTLRRARDAYEALKEVAKAAGDAKAEQAATAQLANLASQTGEAP